MLSLDELRRCGLSRKAVHVRVRNGRLHPMHRGVYAVGHANPPLEGRFRAAVMACGPGAHLSHLSAAALWGFVAWDDRLPEVTVPAPVRRAHPGIRVHRSALLAPEDVSRRKGIPVTSPARTLVDLAARLRQPSLRRAVGAALSLRLVSLPQLAGAVVRLGPRRGARRLAGILATGPAPTRSELEDVVLDLVLRGNLERPDVNVPFVLSDAVGCQAALSASSAATREAAPRPGVVRPCPRPPAGRRCEPGGPVGRSAAVSVAAMPSSGSGRGGRSRNLAEHACARAGVGCRELVRRAAPRRAEPARGRRGLRGA